MNPMGWVKALGITPVCLRLYFYNPWVAFAQSRVGKDTLWDEQVSVEDAMSPSCPPT
jgi:hypothetical protein